MAAPVKLRARSNSANVIILMVFAFTLGNLTSIITPAQRFNFFAKRFSDLSNADAEA